MARKNKPILDAVSIVLHCGDEVFPIIRQNFLRSFPGYTAFPGGKVDREDQAITVTGKLLSNHPDHLMACLMREAMEELQLDVEHEIANGNLTSLDFIARAVTPEFNPYRFATHFFRLTFKKKPKMVIDHNEAAIAEWKTPDRILEEFNRGARLCVPPVRRIIECLKEDIQFQHVETFENRFNLDVEVPHIESIRGIHQIMPLSDTVPPATRTNAFVIGDILIDPSPRDDIELDKFLNVIKKHQLKSIFLTHHHGDHHQNLPKLNKQLKLPVWCSEDTQKRITKKKGSDYFAGMEIHNIQDGDQVTLWLNQKVMAMSIPGHDEGQLGLYPEGKEWFIAGDLFQGIGTVVIGPDEGDMQKYFQTLQKVIDLDPACVIPSHGIALGGTNILQKTLEHRKMREDQILQMYEQGLSNQEMLERIYFDIPEKLFPYAMANIESHLKKLMKEKRIS
jgi:ribonuclease/clavin/mitogillin